MCNQTPQSLMKEGEAWFISHKKEILKELGKKEEEVSFSFG